MWNVPKACGLITNAGFMCKAGILGRDQSFTITQQVMTLHPRAKVEIPSMSLSTFVTCFPFLSVLASSSPNHNSPHICPYHILSAVSSFLFPFILDGIYFALVEWFVMKMVSMIDGSYFETRSFKIVSLLLFPRTPIDTSTLDWGQWTFLW